MAHVEYSLDFRHPSQARGISMDMRTPDTLKRAAPAPPKEAHEHPKDRSPAFARISPIVVGVVVAAVAGLSIWYLVRPEPLLVQGEVDATRFDMAARVDGRAGDTPVLRGQNVAAGAVLVRIDNPETIAKHEQASSWPRRPFERVRQLAEHGNAPQARFDQATDSLRESERATW